MSEWIGYFSPVPPRSPAFSSPFQTASMQPSSPSQVSFRSRLSLSRHLYWSHHSTFPPASSLSSASPFSRRKSGLFLNLPLCLCLQDEKLACKPVCIHGRNVPYHSTSAKSVSAVSVMRIQRVGKEIHEGVEVECVVDEQRAAQRLERESTRVLSIPRI